MRDPVPQLVRLQDYTPPAFRVPRVALDFDIGETTTRVRARLEMERQRPGEPVVLDGEELTLESVSIDGRLLASGEYSVEALRLTVPDVPDRFVLDTVCTLEPHKNTRLMGLYASKDGLF